MRKIQRRADEIIAGDVIDTHCGIGSLAHVTVTRIRYIENNNPRMQDRIEIFWNDGSMCPCREYSASSLVTVIV